MPLRASEFARSFDDTEEFIEQKYSVDIQYTLAIDCTVTQNGWRPASLTKILTDRSLLLPNKELDFAITECNVPSPYDVHWKVLNWGDEAERRNKIRGQIIPSNRASGRHERTEFRGDHLVECYVVKDGVVVARDRIDVPISANS
ncbi:nucleotide-binding domain-containing protein [Dietzia cercidiphylli]|uniref:nucleotide-binding domain-containing protein n=1 Tax=Dietzia cercidiphylli TaxID=498199 RepID=UPI0015CCDC88